MKDWASPIVALTLFALLTPGLIFQLPGKHRAVDFMNMKTSLISIVGLKAQLRYPNGPPNSSSQYKVRSAYQKKKKNIEKRRRGIIKNIIFLDYYKNFKFF
ncbi:hypothetical protein AMTRI_Chr06g171620 [Amborella trichopoda]